MSLLKIALAKGRVSKQAITLMQGCGFEFEDYGDNRKLIFTDRINQVEVFLVKSPDVPVYVESGASDIGIVGKDILLEGHFNVFELLKLDIGKCHMAVAGLAGCEPDYSKKLRVGTKYPLIAKHFFAERDLIVDIIKLNGSVELAPLIGLSDIIVDIVESGKTLVENGLEPYEKFLAIESRLIGNKISYKTKYDKVQQVVEALSSITEEVL